MRNGSLPRHCQDVEPPCGVAGAHVPTRGASRPALWPPVSWPGHPYKVRESASNAILGMSAHPLIRW
eukprot:6786724-Pyramimonas_sp.AAC.1